MESLSEMRVVVTGGASGLGLGIVEALAARHARVMAVGRNAQRLSELAQRLDVATHAGDITDRAVAAQVLKTMRPTVVILNAGATPVMAPLHEQTWESFSAAWETDVKAALYWIQEAVRLPLARGSRVLLGSSGAAIGGSPLSGGYAGAKRMLWMMANYANGVAAELDLGIRFQVIVPLQIIGETQLGHAAASAYAKRKGVSIEAFLAALGKPLPPRQFGEHVVTLLTEPRYQSGTAFGIKGEVGIQPLDGAPA